MDVAFKDVKSGGDDHLESIKEAINQARTGERFTFRSAMVWLSQYLLLATIVVLAWQMNWPLNSLSGFDEASVPFVHILPTLRLVEYFAFGAVLVYILAGWPNRERLLSHTPQRVFALALTGLVIVAALSPFWAIHPGLAAVHAAHMVLWVAFALMIASGDWSESRLAAFFLAGMLIHSAVGIVQMMLQHFVGLGPRFGELPVRPQDTWVSVVFAGAARLLRAYGLSGHPNVLGGHLFIGMILTYGLLVVWPRVWRALIVLAWAIGWTLLLLTFSRSAWLALIVGTLVSALLLLRGKLIERRTIIPALTLATVGVLLAITFVALFYPFLINRVQITAQPFESFSINERAEMLDVTRQLIALNPLTGVGAANFSIASQSVTGGYALDWVHNVPLLITVELGLPGLAMFVLTIGAMLAVARRRWRTRSISLWQALVGAGLVGLMAIMLFDHYLWTAPQGTLLWALLAGWWMRVGVGE